MPDQSRALPAHIAGTTPSTSRSIPITDIEGLDLPSGPALPEPPASGTYVLTSTDGVLSWEDAAEA